MLYDKHVAENELVRSLADTRMLGVLLDQLRDRFGGFELLHHHQQGEFHHDVMVRVPGSTSDLPGEFLVVATNCNGGVK